MLPQISDIKWRQMFLNISVLIDNKTCVPRLFDPLAIEVRGPLDPLAENRKLLEATEKLLPQGPAACECQIVDFDQQVSDKSLCLRRQGSNDTGT